MIYNVFGKIICWFYQLFYKRIYIQGVENIPKGKPVILAANHSNALLDPLMIAIFMLRTRPIYFLTRADIFANKFLIWLFNQVHMKPIYRPHDGPDYVEKNERTFNEVNDWLKEKKTVLIFPEGNCQSMKRLRPLKKGTVRMAFRAWEEGEDVYVVPTGLNYTYYKGARSEVMISYQKPMRIEDYRASFEENPAKAYRLANRDLMNGIKGEMIVVEKPESEELTEQMLTIGRNDFPEKRFPVMSKNHRRLYYEQRIAGKINTIQKDNQPEFEELKQKASKYFDALKSLNTTDEAVVNYKKANSLIVLLLAPFARLLSHIFHFPMRYFKKMAAKMSTKDPSMYMTLWTALLMGGYLVFGLVWMIIGTLLIGFIMSFCIGLIIILITYWTGVILEKRREDKANGDLESVSIETPEKVKALETMRLELSKWIKT